jgi:hypothetical protein
MDPASVAQTLTDLDAWFETMRVEDGYGGPVSHWWRNCLQFAGPGRDWRYEGIIGGYLELYRKTGESRWLARAIRAGDDLLAAQTPAGTFRDSSFELNPYAGGTPHEASCDLALLWLARTLRDVGSPSWARYLRAAAGNLRGYYDRYLWDPRRHTWCDRPGEPSFVPNKAATLAEALILFSQLDGDGEAWVEPGIDAALDGIVEHQIRGGPLDGAICQNSFGGRPVRKLFPFYVARCVGGLIAGYEWSGRERYLDAALRAMRFVLRHRDRDGSFPQVVYENRVVNGYPRWIAATGDILRAIDLVAPFGVQADPTPTERWLRRGRLPSGAFRTAYGFAAQTSQRMRRGRLPELRDLLPVVGWNDKAFRFLASRLAPHQALPPARLRSYRMFCDVSGATGRWTETESELCLELPGRVLFQWRKGDAWVSDLSPRVLTA